MIRVEIALVLIAAAAVLAWLVGGRVLKAENRSLREKMDRVAAVLRPFKGDSPAPTSQKHEAP
ncbi:hypothetical protein [Telmatospirillum sp.]|uniref:hypothetical protein n=1 Tax=Telmatospirillum sp. TaxID=2079197 RepID=UPI00284F49FA|nr:hypothetical protein [Telmatospirillum sp.]MDR3439861.1 hypothetical protein [Telmatospirillum sp.]